MYCIISSESGYRNDVLFFTPAHFPHSSDSSSGPISSSISICAVMRSRNRLIPGVPISQRISRFGSLFDGSSTLHIAQNFNFALNKRICSVTNVFVPLDPLKPHVFKCYDNCICTTYLSRLKYRLQTARQLYLYHQSSYKTARSFTCGNTINSFFDHRYLRTLLT